MGIIEGNKPIAPQGRYGVPGVDRFLKTPPKVEATKIPEAVGKMGVAIVKILSTMKETADKTAVTNGINAGKIAYAEMLEEASNTNPDESLAIFEKLEKEYIESLDGYNPNVRQGIKDGLILESGNKRLELLKDTATAISARDDASVVDLANTMFGSMAEVVTDQDATGDEAISALGAYVENAEQTLWPEYLKRVISAENPSGKWRTVEEARAAFNDFFAGQLAEAAEVMMTRDDSSMASSISEIVYGKYVRESGKDPSGLIEKFKKLQGEWVSKDVKLRGRKAVAELRVSARPVHGDDWEGSIPELTEGLAKFKETLDNDPSLDYETHASEAVDAVMDGAIANVSNFKTIEDVEKFFDVMSQEPIFAGIKNKGDQFDEAMSGTLDALADLTIERRNKILNSIVKDLNDSDVIVTPAMLKRQLEEGLEQTPFPVVKDGELYEELTRKEEKIIVLQQALGPAATYVAGGASQSEYDNINDMINEIGITRFDSLQTIQEHRSTELAKSNAAADKLTAAEESLGAFFADPEGSLEGMTGLQMEELSSTIETFASSNNPNDKINRAVAINVRDYLWENGQVLDVHRNAIEADMDTLLGQSGGAEAVATYLSENVAGEDWGKMDTALREIDWQTKRQDGSIDTIVNLALDGNHGLAKELGKRVDADKVAQFAAASVEANILTTQTVPPEDSMLYNHLVLKAGSKREAQDAVTGEYTRIMSMAREEIDKRLGAQEGDPGFGGTRTAATARKENAAIALAMMDFSQGKALGGEAIVKMLNDTTKLDNGTIVEWGFWDKVVEYLEQPEDSIRVGDGSAGKDDYIPNSEFTSLDMDNEPYVMEGTRDALIERIAKGEYYADYVTAPFTEERVGRVRASKTFFFKPGEAPGNVMEYVSGPGQAVKPEDIYSVMVTPVDTIGRSGQSHDYMGIATLKDGTIVELGKLNVTPEQDTFLMEIDFRNNYGKPNIDNIPNTTWVPK